MAGGPGYSREPGSLLHLLGVLGVMFVVALTYSGQSTLALFTFPVLAVLTILSRIEWGGWLVAYLSIALSLFYASLTIPAMAVLPAYAITLLHYVGGISTRVTSSGGPVGPSSEAVLKSLPLFLVAALANYRLIFSIATLAASILVFTLARYVGLSRFRVLSISYDREILAGGHLTVRVTAEYPGEGYALVSLGSTSKIIKVSGATTLELSLKPASVSRHTLILRVTALDPWLVASKVIAEAPVSFTVLPSYTSILRRLRRELAPIPSTLGEPIKTEAFIIGGGKGAGTAGGPGEVLRYLRLLPQPLRAVARSLLLTLAWSGSGSGVSEGGTGRGVFGEYYGVREFAPGDTLRAIHWKKSVSRGTLIVKEYTTGESAAAGSISVGEYAPIIIADLTPSNPEEFDRLVAVLLDFLHTTVNISRRARTLFIMVFGNIGITLEGMIENVSTRVADAFIKIMPTVMHEYVSIGERINEEIADQIISSGKCCAIVNTAKAATITYIRNITEELVKHGLPPQTIAIIYGKPTILRNMALSNYLKVVGYKVVDQSNTVH